MEIVWPGLGLDPQQEVLTVSWGSSEEEPLLLSLKEQAAGESVAEVTSLCKGVEEW